MSDPDELRVLRTMGHGVGVLDAETDTRIRQRVIDGLRAAGVAAPQVPEARRHEVIDLTEPAVALADRPSRGPRGDDVAALVELHPAGRTPVDRRMRVLAAAAVVVVLFGAVLVAGRVRGHDSGLDTLSGDPQVDQLATTLRAQPALSLDGGKFQHTSTVQGGIHGGTAADPSGTVYLQQGIEDWKPAAGAGLEKISGSQTRPVDRPTQPLQADPQLDTHAGGAPLTNPTFAGFTYADLLQLPTDPVQLRPRLVAAANGSDRAALVREAQSIIDQPVTPPGVRAAAVLVLQAEGLHAVGDRTDSQQRTGDGFELTDAVSGTTWAFVFDKHTGGLLESDAHDANGLPTSAVVVLEVVPVTDSAG